MSNNGFLLNSTSPIHSAADLPRWRGQRGYADGIVAESSKRLPIPWLLCFRRGDLPASAVSTSAGTADPAMPCITVEQAVRNLEASLPAIEAIAGDAALARPYWHLARTFLRRLPFAYLALDARTSGDAGEFARQLSGALAGDLSAVPHLKAISEYKEEAPAYPIDVLYAVGGGVDRWSPRTWNATVLDGGFVSDVRWNMPEGMPPPRLPEPPESTFGELRDAPIRITAWSREAVPEVAGSVLGLTNADGRECLAVNLFARNDADRKGLETDETLRFRLDLIASRRLQPWCEKYGFGWAGVRCSSPDWARR